jgi:hypothetical protein
MGYHMSQQFARFFVSKENADKAAKAIQALHGKETIHDGSGAHFSWVDNKFYEIEGFEPLMSEWRWEVTENDDGDFDSIEFVGEKSGDDLILFQAIAPFVKKGSYIEMQGEDGALWRWVFNGKTCQEVNARVEWDDDEEEETEEEDSIDEEFQELASKINRKLKEAVTALKEVNRLKEEAGLETLIFTSYLRDELDSDEWDAMEAKLGLIDVSDLEAELSDAGWSTSSSYC